MSEKELVTQEAGELTTSQIIEDLGIDMGDVSVGRISVMQSMSQLVQSEDARVGDIINLLLNEKIADKEDAAEFIVVGKPFWDWTEKDGDTFLGRYPGKLPQDKSFTEGTIVRTENQNFYILLAKELKTGFAMPLQLTFRSSSMVTARKLCTFLLKMWMMRKPVHTQVFNLTSLMSKKDKYTWYIPEVAPGRDSTTTEIDLAKVWVDTFKAASTKAVTAIDEDEILTPDKGAPVADDDYTGKF